MPNRRFWLKMIGAADWPLDNFWISQVPDLLTQVRAPRTPSSIRAGDVLVYYAAGAQKLPPVHLIDRPVAVALQSIGRPNSIVRMYDFRDDRYEWRRLFAEAFGTFLLVLVAVGGGVVV